MATTVPTDWMTIAELMIETGMSRSAAYGAASEGKLPVPVYRFGKRYLISRQAWEEMKARQLGEAVAARCESRTEEKEAESA